MTKLISSEEISEAVDFLQDWWGPGWREDKGKRRALDTLHDCMTFVEHYEDAARAKAFAEGQKAVRSGLGDLLKDLAPDECARKAGVGA